MKPDKLLARLLAGQVANVAFEDILRLVCALGFVMDRISGSQHIARHCELAIKLNLQPDRSGDAKPYQVRLLIAIIHEFNLHLDGGR